MIKAGSHSAVASDVISALEPLGLTVLGPPVPSSPIAGPCLVVGSPEAIEPVNVRGDVWTFQVSVLILPSGTTGDDLLDLVDSAMAALLDYGYRVTSRARTYQPPNAPAGLPAYELTLE